MVCPKSKGNTFKVCNYIVNNSDAELLVLDQSHGNNLKEYAPIILCSGVYGDKVHENAKFYVFLTWFGRGQSDKNAIKEVKQLLEEKQMSLESDYITCFGQGMGIIRHGHPNEEDCEKVLNWVKSKSREYRR